MEEVRGFGYADLIHDDDRENAVKAWRKAVSRGTPYENQARLLGADGQYRWFLTRGLPLRDAQGRILRWYGTCTDIDEVIRLRQQLEQERDYLREEVKEARAFGEIIGKSEAIKKVLHQAEQVAGTPATVLLIGETGTGKELLARAIHNLSPRCARPMVTLNCAALPATLVESELFGHEKGAYTGAVSRQIGRFELADGSTLFLDEVGELPLELQAKLLRVLQEGQFERLGSSKPLKADVRIIAATNRDLEKAVKEGRFREDLYYRLNVFPITLPPLRERREDISLLVSTFAKEIVRKMGKTIESIPRSTVAELEQYPWPGNIRELRNIVERALIVSRGSTLRFELPHASSPSPSGGSGEGERSPSRTLEEVERQHILSVLEKTGWRVSGKRGAAAILGLHRSTLESRMAKLGIKRKT
jgi:transcriptional regulator with GAF, ATPase, and Fis domain